MDLGRLGSWPRRENVGGAGETARQDSSSPFTIGDSEFESCLEAFLAQMTSLGQNVEDQWLVDVGVLTRTVLLVAKMLANRVYADCR